MVANKNRPTRGSVDNDAQEKIRTDVMDSEGYSIPDVEVVITHCVLRKGERDDSNDNTQY